MRERQKVEVISTLLTLIQSSDFAHQVQHRLVQELHYLPKTVLQLLQYFLDGNQRRQLLQPRLRSEQQHVFWKQARLG